MALYGALLQALQAFPLDPLNFHATLKMIMEQIEHAELAEVPKCRKTLKAATKKTDEVCQRISEHIQE